MNNLSEVKNCTECKTIDQGIIICDKHRKFIFDAMCEHKQFPNNCLKCKDNCLNLAIQGLGDIATGNVFQFFNPEVGKGALMNHARETLKKIKDITK